MITINVFDFLYICIGCLLGGIPLGYIVQDISEWIIERRKVRK